MNHTLSFDFKHFITDNNLWPKFVEKLGIYRAQQAVRQALDLQLMNGDDSTLPVLLPETCGLALLSMEMLHLHTGYQCEQKGMVLLMNIREKSLQLLREFR